MRDGDKPLQMYPSQVPDHQGVDQVDNEASHLSTSGASSPVPDSDLAEAMPALLGHKNTDSARHPNLPSRSIYYLWLSYIYGIKRDVHIIP